MNEQTLYHAEDGQCRLEICLDPEPMNPREWDSIGTMLYAHRDYILGDKEIDVKEYRSWEDVLDCEILMPNNDKVVYLPLYLYDHSGITMNTTGFSCGWDSGQVGWIYATEADAIETFGESLQTEVCRKQMLKVLEQEVKSFDQYITGEFYGFSYEKICKCSCCGHVTNEMIDSCWGFEEIKFIEDALPDEALPLFEIIKEEAGING